MTEEESWQKVENFIKELTGVVPQDLKGYLFLIGVQTLGKGRKVFTKEQKQDLLHIATCEIFSDNYKFTHRDEQGWPHYETLGKIPHQKLYGQEDLIKQQIIAYFKREQLIG